MAMLLLSSGSGCGSSWMSRSTLGWTLTAFGDTADGPKPEFAMSSTQAYLENDSAHCRAAVDKLVPLATEHDFDKVASSNEAQATDMTVVFTGGRKRILQVT